MIPRVVTRVGGNCRCGRAGQDDATQQRQQARSREPLSPGWLYHSACRPNLLNPVPRFLQRP
jgi:hypothetical protein